jgi:hypothetical protein
MIHLSDAVFLLMLVGIQGNDRLRIFWPTTDH